MISGLKEGVMKLFDSKTSSLKQINRWGLAELLFTDVCSEYKSLFQDLTWVS